MSDLCRELGIGVYPAYWQGDALLVEGGLVHRLSGALGPPIREPALLAKVEALAKQVPLGGPWNTPEAVELDGKTFVQFMPDQGMPRAECAAYKRSESQHTV